MGKVMNMDVLILMVMMYRGIVCRVTYPPGTTEMNISAILIVVSALYSYLVIVVFPGEDINIAVAISKCLSWIERFSEAPKQQEKAKDMTTHHQSDRRVQFRNSEYNR